MTFLLVRKYQLRYISQRNCNYLLHVDKKGKTCPHFPDVFLYVRPLCEQALLVADPLKIYFSAKHVPQGPQSVRSAGAEVCSRDRAGGLAIKFVLQHSHKGPSGRNVASFTGRRSHFSW